MVIKKINYWQKILKYNPKNILKLKKNNKVNCINGNKKIKYKPK
jgi:hypothetical protein